MARDTMTLGKYSLGGTAAVITSMGLIAGLSPGSNPRASIIGGLLVIAIADNISDSFGLHVYKEADSADRRDVFITTVGNFLVRLAVTLSFVALVLLLPASVVVWGSALWGLLLLGIMSYQISRVRESGPLREVTLHLVVAVGVLVASSYIGHLIARRWGGGPS